MKKIISILGILGAVSVAHADESKMKLDLSGAGIQTTEGRDVAKIEEVERPESLKYDTIEYKRHKDFLKLLDRRYNR